MARVVAGRKACTVNPLKMSAALGACYAYLGMDRCMPLMHGSQGCTSFGLVLLVRHFREAIPLQTTAMNEVTTILGGIDNIEQALLNVKGRANPALIGIASTGLTETKGDDVPAYLKLIRRRHGAALAGTEVVYAATPDYVGGFEEGWTAAVTAVVDAFAQPAAYRAPRRVNVLPGSHLTAGDLDELRAAIEAFGLEPVIVPDVSGSLDGHIPDDFTPTTLGGATLDDVRSMGAASATIAVGEQMRTPAALLHDRCGVPFRVFDRLTGLGPCDELMRLLAELSARAVPAGLRRQRSQLLDAMLDAHFFFGGRKVAIAAEPDLLFAMSSLCAELGAEVATAVTTTPSPVLARVSAEEVLIGDLEDFEARAQGCDLLLTHSHGRQAAERAGIPLYRIGLPIFDRLGAAHRVGVGYRGTRTLVFELANVFAAIEHKATPGDWPLTAEALAAARGGGVARRHDDRPRLSCHGTADRLRRGQYIGAAMKVAIATQDRQRVDAHFGWARHIAVYDVRPDEIAHVTTHDFGGDLDEDGNEDKLGPKLAAIGDCAIVYVAAIGGSAAARVVALKVHPIRVPQPEPILDVLERLQGVLRGTPPPWLRKAIRKDAPAPVDFEDEVNDD